MHYDGDQMCDHMGENQMCGFNICASQTVPLFETPTLYDNSLICVTLLAVLFCLQNVKSSSKILLKRKFKCLLHGVTWSCAEWPFCPESFDFTYVIPIPEGSCVLIIRLYIIYLLNFVVSHSYHPLIQVATHTPGWYLQSYDLQLHARFYTRP